MFRHKMNDVYSRDKDRSCLGTTVGKLMEQAGFKPGSTDVDMLKVQSNYLMFKNFSAFNAAFTPMNSRTLKNLFFGTDLLEGQYLYDCIVDMANVAQKTNSFLEPRFSIFGREREEWANFAKWCRKWNVQDVPGVLIAVQVPRVYSIWRTMCLVSSFGEFLRNFWEPVLQAAGNPTAEENADIIWLLRYVRAFDTVDDESREDDFGATTLPPPDEWTSNNNPPYSYYHYYMYA